MYTVIVWESPAFPAKHMNQIILSSLIKLTAVLGMNWPRLLKSLNTSFCFPLIRNQYHINYIINSLSQIVRFSKASSPYCAVSHNTLLYMNKLDRNKSTGEVCRKRVGTLYRRNTMYFLFWGKSTFCPQQEFSLFWEEENRRTPGLTLLHQQRK